MKCEWIDCTLADLGTIIGGATPSTKDISNYENGTISWITPKDLSCFSKRYIMRGERMITQKGLKSCSVQLLPKNTVLFTSRAPIGYVAIADKELCTNQGFKSIIPNEKTDYLFLYYLLLYNKKNIENMGSGTTFKEVSGATMKSIKVSVPQKIEIQKKIASVLSALDDKIELNNKINENLEQQAQALFKSWFVDKSNIERKTIKAEEFFNISIGKTPPRKEAEWFSENSNNIKWVSISDMGNCGMYISDSSEYLIPSAISKFNVKVVPDNTVLLSFKLTVGRIAITDGKMATNEAIAHFITDKTEIKEYLYCYLKNFNFQTMGSTSSIATAVNSKIIKAMPFILPEENELKDFHSIVLPMFDQIKFNQRENTRLVNLRDTLLPKLMSGEIDVDQVQIEGIN